MSEDLRIEVERHDGVDVLRPQGDVDLKVSPKLRRTLLDTLNAGRDIIVDMRDIAYIDSSGIAALAEALHNARKGNRRLALAQPREGALKVLRIARLDQVFTIQDTPDPSFGAAT
jgi:anti-sigma B factor antagonist